MSMISIDFDCIIIVGYFNIYVDNLQNKGTNDINNTEQFWVDSACFRAHPRSYSWFIDFFQVGSFQRLLYVIWVRLITDVFSFGAQFQYAKIPENQIFSNSSSLKEFSQWTFQ